MHGKLGLCFWSQLERLREAEGMSRLRGSVFEVYSPRAALAVGLAASLLALGLGAARAAGTGPASSPWPMLQHDSQHTGRSAHAAPSKLGLEWRFQVQGMPGSPVIGEDETIYLPTGNDEDTQGYLYAINPDGTQRWRYAFPVSNDTNCVIVPTFTAPAVADDGTVYVHVQSGRTIDGSGHCTAGPAFLYAINPDGSKKWSYQLNFGGAIFSSDNVSSPAIAPDGTIYLTARDTGIYAINPDGTLKWVDSPEQTSISSSPAIGSDGTIYFIIGGLHAYTPEGDEKWVADIGGGVPNTRSPSIGAGGTIYACGIFPDACHAVSPAGQVLWSFPLDSQDNTTPAIASDGTIYFVGRDDDAGLYAVNPNGTLRWRTLSEGAPFEKTDHSPVVGADGRLYMRDDLSVGPGGFFGSMFVVNPDGSLSDEEAIPAVSGSGELNPAIGSDGTLYVPQPAAGTSGNYDPTNQYLAAYVQGTGNGGNDVTPPELEAAAKRKQRVGNLAVEVACENEPCDVEVGGKAVAKQTGARSSDAARAASRRFKLKTTRRQLDAGERESVQLMFKRHPKTVRELKRLLNGGWKAKATIKVAATDGAGNVDRARVAVTLKR